MKKNSIYQEAIIILNAYEPKNSSSNSQNPTVLKGKIDMFKIIVGDLNIPFSVINKS